MPRKVGEIPSAFYERALRFGKCVVELRSERLRQIYFIVRVDEADAAVVEPRAASKVRRSTYAGRFAGDAIERKSRRNFRLSQRSKHRALKLNRTADFKFKIAAEKVFEN